MRQIDNIKKARLEKLKNFKKAGINPYPSQVSPHRRIKEVLENFKKFEKKTGAVVGRIRSIREHGGSTFLHIEDGSSAIQLFLSKRNIGEDFYKFFIHNLDVGDFIFAGGRFFTTKKGENTLRVARCQILAKSLLPLPEKWHGLQETEERLRKRYLDILMNPEIKDIFVKKSRFWEIIRKFLKDRGFLEVETPVLENSAGGASATPFNTYHNALDVDVFLRVSMGELWQKRLMVAGYGKTFEIGRQFRNEGMDMEHLQDYTQMEFYWAYANYKDGMNLVEEMYKKIVKEILGKLKFETHGYKIDLEKKWEIYDYEELIKNNTNIDIYFATEENIKKKLEELKIEYDPVAGKWKLVDSLWKYCRKKISGPGFLTNQPVEVSPLAKRNSKDPRKVEQFQVVIAGTEMGNGYSELNDPLDQEKRFEKQTKMKEEGDIEAQNHDKSFVEALKYGMPPVCGFGVSERLFSYIIDKPIKECVIFPLIRPQKEIRSKNLMKKENDQESKEHDKDLGIDYKKAKELLDENVKDEIIKMHCIESGAIMKKIAKRLGRNEGKWSVIGLLHDIDWEKTKDDPSKHTVKAAAVLKAAGGTDFLIETIMSHNYGWEESPELKGKERSGKLQHCLVAAETLTGLIIATALMQPDKKLASVKLSSLKKKFKTKNFAAKANRENILECEEAGIALDEFLEIGLDALQEISDELDL